MPEEKPSLVAELAQRQRWAAEHREEEMRRAGVGDLEGAALSGSLAALQDALAAHRAVTAAGAAQHDSTNQIIDLTDGSGGHTELPELPDTPQD